MVAATTALFCMLLQVIAEQIFGYKDEGSMFLLWSTFAIFIFSLIFFIIRYNKFTNYKEIYFKVEQMSKCKVLILDILSLLYFFIAFPDMLATAIYLGSINNP